MFSSLLIAFLALAAAATIMAVAIQRHRSQGSTINSWQDIRDAFTGHAMKGVREEAHAISDPDLLETDVSMSELLAEGKDGTGYIEPHDILTLRSGRN